MKLGRTVRLSILLLLLVNAFTTAFGQRYDFVVHQQESGLAGNQVNDISQDNSGVIWAATNNGVSAFDGVSFENLDSNSGLAEELCTTIHIAKNGNVWIGHQTGGVSVIHDNEVVIYSEENGLVNNEVHDIIQSEDGRIWVATFGGVSVFDGNQWNAYTTENGLSFNNTQVLIESSEGQIWAGSYGAGVNIISGNSVSQLHLADGLVNNYVTSLLEADGKLYVGTLGGISTWNGNVFDNGYAQRSLFSNQINGLALDANNKLWLATFNGAVRLNENSELVLSEQNGLTENEVLDVFIDSQDNVWLGTKIGLIRVRNLAFSHYESTEDLDLYPSSIFLDSKNNLWAGNEAGGVLKYDGEMFVQAFDDPDINDHNISAIAEDSEGNLWFGTADFGGLFQFDGERFYIYSDEFGLADNNINCLTTYDGLLFIGTPNGLSTYDGMDFEMVYISDDFGTNHITALQVSRDGTLIIGSKDGKVHLYKEGDVTPLEALNTNSAITDIASTEFGLCFTTQNDGVWIVDGESILHVSDKEGLPDSKTQFVFQDGGVLYVGGKSSIHALTIQKDSVAVNSFSYNHGYLGGTPKDAALSKKDDVWFIGTEKGITRFNPEELNEISAQPAVEFVDLQLSYESVNWQKQGFSVNEQGFPVDLDLPYTDNNLRFFFRGIDHQNPEGVRYKWRLEGYEKDWIPLTEQTVANYPSLPHGDYTFQVVACNGNGTCSPSPTTYSFTINPPFWKAWWFHVSLAIIIIGSTVFFIKRRERVLREEKELLEATVEERTKELREQKEIVELQNEHITESIEYASNIQKAILPSVSEMQRAFEDHFVMYRPKDTVGGDFYWVYSQDDISWAAAVDCTGHGVAGAFMSMIGSDLLNQIIIEKQIQEPATVLDELDKGIKLAFAQSEKEFETDQGMDVSLVRLDRKAKTLKFAGAQRPLFMVVDGELQEVEGDKVSISCAEQMNAEQFNSHQLSYSSGTKLYLFSDGIVDQFGGPKGKKFMQRRLRDFINENHHLSLTDQATALDNTFDDWKGTEHDQLDDVMLMAIQL